MRLGEESEFDFTPIPGLACFPSVERQLGASLWRRGAVLIFPFVRISERMPASETAVVQTADQLHRR